MKDKILVGEPQGKTSFGRPRHIWEHNIKMVKVKGTGKSKVVPVL
jgi:hypothetical protein